MKKSRFIPKLVLLCVIIALIVVSIMQNISPATIRFLTMEISAPVIAVIIVSLFVGFLSGILTFSIIYGKDGKKEESSSGSNASTKK